MQNNQSLPYPGSRGAVAWLLQRLTGVLLLLTLFIHIWVLHFANVGQVISYDNVASRLITAFFVIVDSSLLALLLYHGLNGVRNVIFDYSIGLKAERAVNWVLIIVGLATFVYGLNALLPFITGQPLFYR